MIYLGCDLLITLIHVWPVLLLDRCFIANRLLTEIDNESIANTHDVCYTNDANW